MAVSREFAVLSIYLFAGFGLLLSLYAAASYVWRVRLTDEVCIFRKIEVTIAASALGSLIYFLAWVATYLGFLLLSAAVLLIVSRFPISDEGVLGIVCLSVVSCLGGTSVVILWFVPFLLPRLMKDSPDR